MVNIQSKPPKFLVHQTIKHFSAKTCFFQLQNNEIQYTRHNATENPYYNMSKNINFKYSLVYLDIIN